MTERFRLAPNGRTVARAGSSQGDLYPADRADVSGSRTTTARAQHLLARAVQPLAGVVCAALGVSLASCGAASSAMSGRPASVAAAPAASSAATPTPVPSRSVTTRPPVPLQSPASFDGRVEASVVRTASVVSEGSGPGEIAGAPAVAVTLRLTNSTSRTLPLDAVIVNATYGPDATPASPVDGKPALPFRGSVGAGRSATGVYVFAIPKTSRRSVAFSISYRPGGDVVVLRGAVRE